MFKRWFAKYARAISDERERAAVYRLFCSMAGWTVAFLVTCVAVIVMALAWSEEATDANPELFLALFGGALALWFITAIAALASLIIFKRTYKKIIARPAGAEEMPEVAAYRQKVREDGKSTAKSTLWAKLLLAAGVVFLVAAIIIETVKNPESEEFGPLVTAGIIVFAVTLCVYLISVYLLQVKKTSRGETAEMQTEKEARAIDAAQGREYRYDITRDANAASYRYLYPDERLRVQVENLQKKQARRTSISVWVSLGLGFIFILVFCTPYILDFNLQGYAYPGCLAILVVFTLGSSAPVLKKAKAVEREQVKELETNPDYAENYEIYKIYRDFSKFNGKIIYIAYILSLAAGFILAAFFPHSMISFSSAAILVIGLFINYKLAVGLRQRVRPLEEEIDRAAASLSEKAEKADLSEEAENTEEETETPACPPEA